MPFRINSPDALDDAHALEARHSGDATVRNRQDLGVSSSHGGKSSPLVRRQQRLTGDMAAGSFGRGYSR